MADNASESALTHVDETGRAHMVDVTDKPVTVRVARASGSVRMSPATLSLVRENAMIKGDVIGVARIAGVMAAKRTSELIPLCHGLPLSAVEIEFSLDPDTGSINIASECRTEAKTGVEMEALTAVTVAALTIYDMCKAVDRRMVIENVRVTHKSGGRSGTYESAAES
ncbi:MAG: cyclic pyranopterin monophosphate synthase MoaC [Chloroflexota bacterium]